MQSNPKSTSGQAIQRPTLGRIEEQRRSRLHAVLRDVRVILDATPEADRGALADHIAPLVARVVIEIAVLDRETDAGASFMTYSPRLAVALGWEDEAWRAIALWREAAPEHLCAFRIAWEAHRARAERHSESQHRHVKLIDLNNLSAALSLTRPRIRRIFGKPTCALEPVRMRESEFTPEERREIRVLARGMGYSRDHLAILSFDPEQFCNVVLDYELSKLPEEQLAPHRGLRKRSDPQLKKSLLDRRFRLKRRPGPAPDPQAVERRVEELAPQKRVSPRTIWNWINEGASTAPLTSGDIEADGISETEAQIARIAMEVPRHGRRQTAIDKEIVELLTRWKTATTGRAPASNAWIRKTKERHGLSGLIATARQWEADNEFLKQEQGVDAIWNTHALPRISKHEDQPDRATARPVRGSVEHQDLGADTAPRDAKAPDV